MLRDGPQLQPFIGWPPEVDVAVGAIWSAHIPATPPPPTNKMLLFGGVVAGS